MSLQIVVGGGPWILEDEGKTFLWYDQNPLPSNAASQYRRPESSITLVWKSQNSHGYVARRPHQVMIQMFFELQCKHNQNSKNFIWKRGKGDRENVKFVHLSTQHLHIKWLHTSLNVHYAKWFRCKP